MSVQTGLVKSEQGSSLVQSDKRPTVTPACDVYESKDEILLVADVPGVAHDRLEVHLDEGELTITAHRDLSPRDQGSLVAGQYRSCDFRRRFALPGGIDASRISADLKEGVLRLHMPKSEALKPREIPVRAG